MKVKVIHPDGFYFNKEKHPEGTELEITGGAVLQAGLHFEQIAEVKSKKAGKPDEPEKPGEPKK